MRPGIFARTFARAGFEQIFDAVKSSGVECLQFNFACSGLPTLPEKIPPELVHKIRLELETRSLSMVAISGTCNLIHPDRGKRGRDLRRLQGLIEISNELGAGIVTLCTGTGDRSDMWRAHPQNASPEAWRDLLSSLEMLVPVAEKYGVFLGIEPESANVISSAPSAAKLLREIRSRSLKIIFDAANLIDSQEPAEQRSVLSEAFDLLGPEIVLAHAKDLVAIECKEGIPEYKTVAAGKGFIDYDFYVSNLRKAGFNGALVLHSLEESEVPASVEFVRRKLNAGC